MEKTFMVNDDEAVENSVQTTSTQNNNVGNAGSSAIPPASKDFMSREEIMKGLKIFFVGSAIGLIVFLLAYWGLYHFDINYVISAVLAVTIALIILWALNKSMGDKKSKMEAPITMVLFIAFLFTILTGYKSHGSLFDNKNDDIKQKTTEMVTLHSVGEIWFTDKTFKVGTELKIEVIYNDVLMVNCNNLSVGVHRQRMVKEGKIIFRGLVNEPAQIKVTY